MSIRFTPHPAREVTTLLVTIEQDPVPGWGHMPEYHEAWLRVTLTSLVPHYHPTVRLLECEEKRHLRPHSRHCIDR